MPVRHAFRNLLSRVAAAETLPEVYRSALDCLHETLDVERASVLVFDAGGRMRFVAWTDLSDAYRAAVDGHSPWTPGDADAQPVLVEDAAAEPSLAAFRALFEAEGIRALAFVPLRFGPKLLGKFMLYYGEPHAFTAEEIATAEIIAGHIAFAVEHHRIAAALSERLVVERELRSTAERQAELRQEHERRLRLALAAGRMGAWEWDIPTGRVEWSGELEALHGIEPGAFGGDFAAFRRDIHPADRERVAQAIAEALESPENDYRIEYRILPPDGVPRWLASHGRVLLGRSGRPERMVGICSDITERKRMEEARRFIAEAGQVLATTLDPEIAVKSLARLVVPRLADWCVVRVLGPGGTLVPVEVAHRDPAQVDRAWSIARRWPANKRSSPAAIVETVQPRLIPRIDREWLAEHAQDEEHLRSIEALGLRSAVTVPLQARGRVLGVLSLIAAESHRTYGPDDLELAEEIASWAALAMDNAQLYADAEEARALAERRRLQLQALAALSDELATVLDPETALKRLAARTVGAFADYCITYTHEDGEIRRVGFGHGVESKMPLVEAMSAAAAPRIEDGFGVGQVIRTGEGTLTAQVTREMVERIAVDEAHRAALRALDPCSAMIVPLKARGRTLGAVTFAATMDSGRHYDEDDFRVATELAQRAALLIDNARLYAEARSAVRARDEMLTVVSHDLRNPLQSIAAGAALLQLDPPREQRARTLESIELASSQMAALLQDLLDISRMDAGQFSVALDGVDPVELIEEAQTLFQPQADGRRICLERQIAAGLPPVRADRARILQVLANLLGNALRFVPAGGTITLAAEWQGEAVRFAVSDTGAGIAEEHLTRVFERFWRADGRAQRGAGLGLALAKGIVEAHGGQIGVASKVGEGTTFHFTLPVQPQAAAKRAASDARTLTDRRVG